MVAVLADHGVDVGLPPLREDAGVVVPHLRVDPHVERLVHDDHAETVTRVEERFAGRMVRAADGVEPGRFQNFDAALVGAFDCRRPDHTIVVMDARPAEVHDLTVDPQAPSSVDLQRPDAEGGLVTVDLDAVTVTDHDPAPVQGRRIQTPTARVGHGQSPPDRRRTPREARQRRHLGSDHHSAVIDDLGLHRRRERHGPVVLDDRPDLNDSKVVVDLRRRHPQAVQREMNGLADHELDVAVDPGTGVPAGVLLRRHVDADLVLLAMTDEMIDRQREARVPVGVMPREAPVHPHHGVAVHTLELHEHPLSPVLRRDHEVLLVLPRTTREIRVSRTLRRATGRTDHHVMRQQHRRPRRHPAAALQERTDFRPDAPAVVERHPLHRPPLHPLSNPMRTRTEAAVKVGSVADVTCSAAVTRRRPSFSYEWQRPFPAE